MLFAAHRARHLPEHTVAAAVDSYIVRCTYFIERAIHLAPATLKKKNTSPGHPYNNNGIWGSFALVLVTEDSGDR